MTPFRSSQSRDLCLAWYEQQIASMRPPTQERDLEGTHVLIAGPPGGEPLWLLHGAGGNAAMLRDEIGYYTSRGFRVFAPDIPGHLGKSEPRRLDLRDATIGQWLDRL